MQRWEINNRESMLNNFKMKKEFKYRLNTRFRYMQFNTVRYRICKKSAVLYACEQWYYHSEEPHYMTLPFVIAKREADSGRRSHADRRRMMK